MVLVPQKFLCGVAVLTFCTLSANDHSVSFETACRRDLLAAVAEAAALHPKTLAEDRERLALTRKRQRDLHAWQQQTPPREQTDLRNRATAFHLLGHRKFLSLPTRQRRAFLRQLTAYLDALETHLPASLDLQGNGQAYLQSRLTRPLQFAIRQLPGRRRRRRPALYLAATRTIYFDLDALGDDPAQLIDAFAHEFWHHLLPPDPQRPADHPWFEGYTECLAHIWHDRLFTLAGLAKPAVPVDYPIACAWASLFLGRNPQAALKTLAGLQTRAAFATEFGQAGALPTALAQHFADPTRLQPAELARIQALLRGWGWRENATQPFVLAPYIDQNHLSNERLKAELKQRKEFFNDLIRAKTIVHLQDLLETFGRRRLRAGLKLPKPLVRNLDEVLAYASEPRREFRYWQSIQEHD